MPDYVRYILNSRSPNARTNNYKAQYIPVDGSGHVPFESRWDSDAHYNAPDTFWMEPGPQGPMWGESKDRAFNWAQDINDMIRQKGESYLNLWGHPDDKNVGLTISENRKTPWGRTQNYKVSSGRTNNPERYGIANSSMTKRANMCKCGSGMSKSMCKCGSRMSKAYGLTKAKEKICDCGRPVSKCTCSGHEHGRKTSKRMSKSKNNVPDYVRYISQSRSPNTRTERKTSNPWTADGHFGSSAMEELNNMFPGAVFSEDSRVPGGVAHMNSYLSNGLRNMVQNMVRSPLNRKQGSGVGTSKRMSKAMDMKTRAPKMPSTRRDIRNTDKYFR